MEFEPKIIYEDNHLLVVIKPKNIAVQEDSSKDKDMLTLLKEMIKDRDKKTGNVFLGLVHRLDRPTGGVMVFAKTSKAAARLAEQLKAKQMTKKYLCVVNGKPNGLSGLLKCHLKKDETKNTVYLATQGDTGAKYAELYYETIRTSGAYTLLDIDLFTGRSHQIRVQMASQIKTPIYGDFKYGDRQHGGVLGLWAYELKFSHPTNKKAMTFKVLPDTESLPFSMFKLDIDKL